MIDVFGSFVLIAPPECCRRGLQLQHMQAENLLCLALRPFKCLCMQRLHHFKPKKGSWCQDLPQELATTKDQKYIFSRMLAGLSWKQTWAWGLVLVKSPGVGPWNEDWMAEQTLAQREGCRNQPTWALHVQLGQLPPCLAQGLRAKGLEADLWLPAVLPPAVQHATSPAHCIASQLLD